MIPGVFPVLGDARSNQNPALLAFSILFFRWHNVIAAQIEDKHPELSDEEIFQKTRRLVVATLQVGRHLNRVAKDLLNLVTVKGFYILLKPIYLN